MNANPKFLSDDAVVDAAAIAPLPNSRKIYVTGSRPDIRVPMREITQSDTNESFGSEKFKRVSSVDGGEWKRELKLQDELLQLLGSHLPRELAARRETLGRSLG